MPHRASTRAPLSLRARFTAAPAPLTALLLSLALAGCSSLPLGPELFRPGRSPSAEAVDLPPARLPELQRAPEPRRASDPSTPATSQADRGGADRGGADRGGADRGGAGRPEPPAASGSPAAAPKTGDVLTLEAAVGRALERSHEIQAAQAARDASQAQAAGARAAWWPELDAIARGGIDQNTRDRDGNRQPGGEVWRSEAGVSARWTLASWGARAARELAGQAGLAATEEQVRVVVLRMASRVIALYLEILRLRDLTETAEFNFNETVRFRDRVAGAVSGGERLSVAAEIDVRVAQRRQSLLERLESLQRAESQLTLLIGGPVGDLIEPEPTTPAVATLDQLVELARRESRLVAAAEARAAAAAAAYDAARAERWGTLGLDLEATAGRNVGGAEGRATSVTGLLVARLPLAGGARSALAAEAAGRSQQAREELAQTIRDVAAGTRDAYDVYAYAAQRREAAEAEYTAQAAKLALFEAEFARGAVQRQLTDVLEQIEASANARSRVASMRYAELLAIYALLRESGLLHETLGTRELADRLVRRLRSDPPLLMLLAGLTAPPAAQAGGASPSGAAPSGGSGAVP